MNSEAPPAREDWRSYIQELHDSIRPEQIIEYLTDLEKSFPGDREMDAKLLGTLLGGVLSINLILIAALEPPPAQVLQRLTEVAQALSKLDYKTGLDKLSRHERQIYNRFAKAFKAVISDTTPVAVELFSIYGTNDYDLAQDANELIAQADQICHTDLQAARHLVARAGAMALRGAHLWPRWRHEIAKPLQDWTYWVTLLADTVTYDGSEPLGTPAEERQKMQEGLKAKKTIFDWHAKPQPISEEQEIDALDELIELLFNGPEALTPQLEQKFAALGEPAIERLISLAQDDELWAEDAPGEGYASINAVELLGKLKATQAVPALIDILADTYPDEIIHDQAIVALENIGPPAAPAILETLCYSRNQVLKASLAYVLGTVGAGQPGAFEALERLYHELNWDNDRTLVVMGLSELGDKRAIPLLQQALADPDLLEFNRIEVYEALEQLGAETGITGRPLIEEQIRDSLNAFLKPEQLLQFVRETPRDQRDHPAAVAYQFTYFVSRAFLRWALRPLFVHPESAEATLDALERCAQELDFSQNVTRWRGFERRVAEYLAEKAGPNLRLSLQGSLTALRAYIQDEYDLSHNPNQLLSEARRLQQANPAAALAKVGEAGALALRGKHIWPRWSVELQPPACHWVHGLDCLIDEATAKRVLPWLSFAEEAKKGTAGLRLTVEPAPATKPQDKETLLRELFCGKDELRPGVTERFHAAGPAMVSYLRGVLNNRLLVNPRGRGKGWAPGHAARLLGELGAGEAAADLVGAVADMPAQSHLAVEAANALLRLGTVSLPAIEEYLRWSEQEDKKALLHTIASLIRSGKNDSATPSRIIDKESQSRLSQFEAQGRPVGRNDPCPCGSGKKYKHCCMRKNQKQ